MRAVVLLLCATALVVALCGSTAAAQTLRVLRPHILTTEDIPAQHALFSAPQVLGRSCDGPLKVMTSEASCALAVPLQMSGLAVDRSALGEEAGDVPPADDYRGAVALIPRGDCSFHVKALAAERAGAIGVVITTSGDLPPMMALTSLPPPRIPVYLIRASTGVSLVQAMERYGAEVILRVCFNANQLHYG